MERHSARVNDAIAGVDHVLGRGDLVVLTHCLGTLIPLLDMPIRSSPPPQPDRQSELLPLQILILWLLDNLWLDVVHRNGSI